MANPGPSVCETAAANDNFEKWVRENGGDNDLLELLKENGFTLKQSLGNLDFQSPDASLFVDLLNYGQKCLLQGLVKLLNKPQESAKNPYTSGASKAASLSGTSKNVSLKEKIGRMFHFNAPGDSTGKSSGFAPVPSLPKAKGKRKAPEGHGKSGPVKKKVKQMKLKIIALPKMSKRTPTGTYRDQLTHHIWINMDASEQKRKLQLCWGGLTQTVSATCMHAQGKNLRKAELSDVEFAESWDLDTLRALMGSGVVENPDLESSDS